MLQQWQVTRFVADDAPDHVDRRLHEAVVLNRLLMNSLGQPGHQIEPPNIGIRETRCSGGYLYLPGGVAQGEPRHRRVGCSLGDRERREHPGEVGADVVERSQTRRTRPRPQDGPQQNYVLVRSRLAVRPINPQLRQFVNRSVVDEEP